MRDPAESRSPTRHLPFLLAAPGLLALLAEPVAWLLRTWLNSPSSGSGPAVAALCLALLMRSATSGGAPANPAGLRRAAGLVLGAAALRLAGRLLAVNILGALALCLDLWGLGLALRVRGRPWPIQPSALAALFALALPVERVLQRLFGQPLRLVATAAAERLLQPAIPGLRRAGTVLAWNGAELDIDLPCSGARGLILLCALALVLACRRRTSRMQALAAALAVAAGALLANTLRIAGLFAGTAAGLPVLEEPGHSLIGLAGLGLGALPLLCLARACPPLRPAAVPPARGKAVLGGPMRIWGAAAFSLGALAVALAPAHPVDVSRSAFSRTLPANLGAWPGEGLDLSAQERAYFDSFGGSVSRRAYRRPGGAMHSVLLVTSSAPLRHLHEPEECLAWAGFRLERLGLRPGRVPTVLWKATGPDGAAWRVEASYASESGEGAASLPEVVWRWMARPEAAWSLVERVSPWSLCETDPRPCRHFDRVLFAALDLPFEEVPP